MKRRRLLEQIKRMKKTEGKGERKYVKDEKRQEIKGGRERERKGDGQKYLNCDVKVNIV